MKLYGGDVEGMEKRNFKRGKGEPKVESLNNHSVHQKIMRRVRVNYSNEIIDIHMLHNDITFPS
jgi:hypothetical protein